MDNANSREKKHAEVAICHACKTKNQVDPSSNPGILKHGITSNQTQGI